MLASGKVLIVGGADASGHGVAGAALYDPDSNTWSSAASLATGRFAHTATLLHDGKVLVVGGVDGSGHRLASAELYNPVSNTWSSAASPGTAYAYHSATLLPSGRVLVAGGVGNSGTVQASAELYDPASNTWSPAASLAAARYRQRATLLASGKVLITGGASGPFTQLTSAELYDPAGDTWTAAGNLGMARDNHTATLLPSGQVLVTGGLDVVNIVSSAELYDPANSIWRATASLSTARAFHTATLLPSGKVLVSGGYLAGGTPATSTGLYDPASNTWSVAASLTTARYRHTATVLPSGKVLVAGGQSSASSYVATAELFDPATNAWSGAGSLLTARSAATATLLASGKVLVAGGQGASGYLASAELYDPASNTWSATGSMLVARYGNSATLLPSGKVLVAGGYGLSGRLASAELYDPARGTWSAAGSLATGRGFHTATLLPSGKVLVAGGSGSSANLASAELYDPASNSWSAAGNLTSARELHTATLLPSGKVLVAGGFNSGFISSAELYDPASNSWSAAGNLATGREGHSATLLPSGQVLIVGGLGPGATTLDSAELYTHDIGIVGRRRPVLASATSPLFAGDSLQLSGSGFEGDSEAADGSSQNSTTNYPLVQLRRIDDNQIVWTAPAAGSTRSDTSYTSAPLPALPAGPYVLALYVNALPAASRIVRFAPRYGVTPTAEAHGTIAPNRLQTVNEGTSTTFTVTPDPGYSASVGGTCGGTLSGTSYMTNVVTANCTVDAAFIKNPPPTANTQTVSVAFNTAQTITLTGSDANLGGSFDLTYAIATLPSHGSLSGFDAATGAVTYTPDTGYSGADSFSFTGRDVNGTSASATVSLNIAAAAALTADPQSLNVAFNSPKSITLTGNDPNPGGPFALSFAVATPPSHGSLSAVNPATGAVIYTPDTGYGGTDSFSFTASDINGASAPATLNLSVAAGAALVANPQSVVLNVGTTQMISLSGSDPNPGGPFTLSYAIVSAPDHGSLSGLNTASGSVIYTPNPGYAGTDSFSFTIADVDGTSAPADVNLRVTIPAIPAPTLHPWAMLALLAGLLGLGIRRGNEKSRERRRTQ